MKLAEICVRHPVFTVMLIAFLVTLGVFSYRGLAVDLFPKADPATVNVEVALPGATPEEMVTGIVLPLEDAISSVSGIDEISVYATEGRATSPARSCWNATSKAQRRTCGKKWRRRQPPAARDPSPRHHQARSAVGSDHDVAGQRPDEPPRADRNRR